MEKIDIVIAYYNESNIDWIKNDIPENFNIYLYTKSNNLQPLTSLGLKNSKCKIIELPNVGRESDTYLHHIIKNYDNLADLTIFTQAAPHIHSPDFSNLLKHYKDFEGFQCLTDRYLTQYGIPSQEYLEEKHVKDKHLNGCKCAAPLSSSRFLQSINYFDIGTLNIYVNALKKFGLIDKNIQNKNQLFKALNERSNANIIEVFLNKCGITPKFNGGKIPSIYFYCTSACFGVKKDRILQNSLENYENLKKFNLEDGVIGYLIERSWTFIFGPVYNLKTLLNDLNINNLE